MILLFILSWFGRRCKVNLTVNDAASRDHCVYYVNSANAYNLLNLLLLYGNFCDGQMTNIVSISPY